MQDSRNTSPSSDQNHNVTPKPDVDTIPTADPQKNMEGPVSSTMHKTGEAFDSDETQEEADRERDAGM